MAQSGPLFGRSLAVADFSNRPALVGVGLRDWDGCVGLLVAKLDYTTTSMQRNCKAAGFD